MYKIIDKNRFFSKYKSKKKNFQKLKTIFTDRPWKKRNSPDDAI